MKNKSIKYQLGATMVEYALLIALIAVTGFPAVKQLGRQTKCQTYRYNYTLAVAECSGCSFILNGLMWQQTHPDYMTEVKNDFDMLCGSSGASLLDQLW